MLELIKQLGLKSTYWLLDRLRTVKRYRTLKVAERPDVPKRGVIYIIGNGEYIWEASMRCPRGCGYQLSMNLQPDLHPHWKITEHLNGSVSLTPSIWRKRGCGCHFFLKQGKIERVD